MGIAVGDLENPLIADGFHSADGVFVADRQLGDGLVVARCGVGCSDLVQDLFQGSVIRYEIVHEDAPPQV
ncbi:hypothetical protein [Williamsia herbipolensis]|uniref:hypothetical protein n=1 Tax=Williamsia herbipolensis TaxID=1603258 RepID=UPI001EF12250|nr:hypothetical protein [Williamsia herbipolensis]